MGTFVCYLYAVIWIVSFVYWNFFCKSVKLNNGSKEKSDGNELPESMTEKKNANILNIVKSIVHIANKEQTTNQNKSSIRKIHKHTLTSKHS